jgi:multidrug transporter EmrE-like cation transporter
MDYHKIFWFIIGAITSAIPAPFVKLYLTSNNRIWLILASISYLLLLFVYTIVLKNENLTVIYFIIKILAVLLTATLDFLIFRNVLTIKKIFGFLLAIISLVLLSS